MTGGILFSARRYASSDLSLSPPSSTASPPVVNTGHDDMKRTVTEKRSSMTGYDAGLPVDLHSTSTVTSMSVCTGLSPRSSNSATDCLLDYQASTPVSSLNISSSSAFSSACSASHPLSSAPPPTSSNSCQLSSQHSDAVVSNMVRQSNNDEQNHNQCSRYTTSSNKDMDVEHQESCLTSNHTSPVSTSTTSTTPTNTEITQLYQQHSHDVKEQDNDAGTNTPNQQYHEPHHPHGRSGLPRCAVVNFCKDGDSLRWAPRVSHNVSGVPARVHNFEDAFTLEEYSSTALPMLWHATGGNPLKKSMNNNNQNHNDQNLPVISIPASTMSSDAHAEHTDYQQHYHHHQNAALLSGATDSAPCHETCPFYLKCRASNDGKERDGLDFAESAGRGREKGSTGGDGSSSYSQRAFSRVESVRKTLVVAQELHRPSFWSMLAQSRKHHNARMRLPLPEDESTSPKSTGPGRFAGLKCSVGNRRWRRATNAKRRSTFSGGHDKATAHDSTKRTVATAEKRAELKEDYASGGGTGEKVPLNSELAGENKMRVEENDNTGGGGNDCKEGGETGHGDKKEKRNESGGFMRNKLGLFRRWVNKNDRRHANEPTPIANTTSSASTKNAPTPISAHILASTPVSVVSGHASPNSGSSQQASTTAFSKAYTPPAPTTLPVPSTSPHAKPNVDTPILSEPVEATPHNSSGRLSRLNSRKRHAQNVQSGRMFDFISVGNGRRARSSMGDSSRKRKPLTSTSKNSQNIHPQDDQYLCFITSVI